MSRKFDRNLRIERRVKEIMGDPRVTEQLAMRIFRGRPRLIPKWLWRFFLWIVIAPPTKRP